MPDVIKRLKYFNGQFLRQPDFTDEQDYHLDRQRRHNRQFHTPGIAEGLAVTANPNATSVSVAPGTAIDGLGRQIVLHETDSVGFSPSLNGQSALVVISYHEEESDPATVGEVKPTRWKERPKLEAILDSGTLGNEQIALVKLQISSSGTIAQSDMSVRTPVGARLHPDATIERLRLSRQGVPANQWPVLTSGAASRADLAGSLSVTGNILVTGTVDGRDVSADGATLDNLALSKIAGISNPGGNIPVNGAGGITVTPDVNNKTITIAGSAPSSIAGVSNPGGNIPVNGATGITVTPDVANKKITIAGSAPSSIAGVSNPGGDINLVGSGISIAADNSNNNKKITFSTNPAAIGALPASDYLRRTLSFVSFGTGNVSGATSTITLSFQPKMIWVSGRVYAQSANNDDSYFGGVTHGYCKVDSPDLFTQYGHGPTLKRWSQGFGGVTWSIRNYYTTGMARFDFDDRSVSPRRNVLLDVSITNVTANQVVFTFNRDFRGFSEPLFYFVELYATILG